MYRSRCRVEIGFDAAPGTLDPLWSSSGFTWTDVTDDVIAYDWQRGGGEFEGVRPGVGSLTLDNSAGVYDPSNGGSPYAGSLVSGKPWRIFEQINLLSELLAAGDSVAGLTAQGGAVLSVSLAQFRSAVSSISYTGGTGTAGFRTATGTSGVPVVAGEPLTAGAWVRRTSATGRSATIQLRFYDSAGVFLSTVTGSAVTTSTSWQQITVQTTAPAGAAFVAVWVQTAGTVAGDAHFVDDLHLVPADGDAALQWFPGGWAQVGYGRIESWLPVQVPPSLSTTTCTLSGPVAVVANAPVGESLWSTFVTRSKPALWWRLGERDETEVVADSSGNGRHGRYRRDAGGTPVTFTDGLIRHDSDGAVNFDAVWRQYVEGPGLSWPTGPSTLCLWVKAYPAASACTLFDSSVVTVQMSAAGAITATYLGLTATTTGRDIRDNQPHLVTVHVDTAGTLAVHIDADDGATDSGLLTAARTMLRLYVARDQAGTVSQFATVTIDEVTVWHGVHMAIEWLYLTGRAGGVRGGDPVGRLQPTDVAQFILELFGTPRPFGTTAVPAGSAPMVIDTVPMSAPLDMLNIAATTGRLVIGEAADGTPTVWPALYQPSMSTVHIDPPTIGHGAGQYPYRGAPLVDFGESSVINTITVSRPDLAPIVYRDETSIDARGERPMSITVWSTIDRCARDTAAWLLAQYGVEGRRLHGITLQTTRPDVAQLGLWIELADVITVVDETVDGRTIATVARVVGKTVARVLNEDGLGELVIGLLLAPVRIQPMVLDTTDYGVLGPDVNVGKWGP